MVQDQCDANGAETVEVIERIRDYDGHRVTRDRSRSIRRARARFEFRLLADRTHLLEGGFGVASSAVQRRGGSVAASQRMYRGQIEARYEADAQLVVGVFDGCRLVAYAMSHAIESNVYFTDLVVSDTAAREHVGDGLYWFVLRSWAQVPGVARVQLGIERDERPQLWYYKRTFGAELVTLPTFSGLRRPAASYLRRFRPQSYSRLMVAVP